MRSISIGKTYCLVVNNGKMEFRTEDKSGLYGTIDLDSSFTYYPIIITLR